MSRARVSTVSEARWAAYKVLYKVESEQAFTSILLPVYEEELKIEDRALCHQLTLGIIRHQLFLDKIIEHFAAKKLEKFDLPVLLALRLGVYQLRFMSKIPARAAINESVEIVKKEKLVSAAGFVNAILRRVTEAPDFDPAEKLEGLEKLSIMTSHPLWLLEKWAAEFGIEEAAKLAAANNEIPRTCFRLNNPDENVLRELTEAGVEFAGSIFVPGAFVVKKSNRKLYDLAEQGRIVIQDEASQLVAHLVGLKPDENFLDACAAPGNKTTQIVSEVRANRAISDEAFYAAGDLHPHRLETLRKNLAKAGIDNVEVFQYDAAEALPFEPETFDCILVDAPCSGTGTIRHNPEIRWSLKPEDISELAEKQKKILTQAARVLRKNGRIIYSTCSVEREENEAVVESFLKSHLDFAVEKIKAGEELVTSGGFLRTFPQRDYMDGFFAAVMKKF